jgi:hypothetical protein
MEAGGVKVVDLKNSLLSIPGLTGKDKKAISAQMAGFMSRNRKREIDSFTGGLIVARIERNVLPDVFRKIRDKGKKFFFPDPGRS